MLTCLCFNLFAILLMSAVFKWLILLFLSLTVQSVVYFCVELVLYTWKKYKTSTIVELCGVSRWMKSVQVYCLFISV